MNNVHTLETLAKIPLFRDLPIDALAMIAAETRPLSAPAGTSLFGAGDSGDEMFLVEAGAVLIYLSTAAGEEKVAELGPGRWFGEMALITGEPRSAGARATTDASLLVLSRTSFQSLLARLPVLGLRLSEELSRRLRSRLVSRSNSSRPLIVLLDQQSSKASSATAVEIAAAIAAELDETIAYVDLGADGTVAPPEAAAAAGQQLQWHPCRDLAELERLRRSYATVVLRMPEGHGLEPAIRNLEGVSISADALKLPAARRSQIARGIVSSPMQQLVRALIGRRIGLVFGAGGAKGLCHVGAIRAFEKAGLRFDMLAGTSLGGIIAALVALGWDSDRLLEYCERLRTNFRKMLVDFTIPSGSLLRGVKKRQVLAELADGKRFEDLSVPLWLVSADLVLQREFVFDQGGIALALDATSAIPTVFPVVNYEDRQLVDGWVVNPFPADVLRRKGADIVIGVDPNVADERHARPHPPHKPSRWWRKLMDPRKLVDPAGIVRVAMQAMDAGARERTMANLSLVDICVKPALGAYSITDIRKFPALVAAGEAAAEASMAAIASAVRPARTTR